MSDQQQEQPGEQEPEWPLWTRRTTEWEIVDEATVVCPCRWLHVQYEDLMLGGGVGWSAARCVDCGQVWEKRTCP